jgi:hypothetical protein
LKVHLVVIVLGIYIFAMGMVGMARTGAFTPLYISGAIAAVTVWVGWLLGKGLRPVRNFALTWLTIITAALAYMSFGRTPAHGDPDATSTLIFGSMALFTLIALVLVWRVDPRRGPRRF